MRGLLTKSAGAAVARWRKVRATSDDALPPAFREVVTTFPPGARVRARLPLDAAGPWFEATVVEYGAPQLDYRGEPYLPAAVVADNVGPLGVIVMGLNASTDIAAPIGIRS